jgi:hypothetical protein
MIPVIVAIVVLFAAYAAVIVYRALKHPNP